MDLAADKRVDIGVRRMGGTLGFASRAGVGTGVAIELPA